MKKKVVYQLFVSAFVVCAFVVGVNINLKGISVNLSDIALSNIEILAQNESGGSDCNTVNCPGGCCEFTWGSTGDKCYICCPSGDKAVCTPDVGCDCT